MASSQDMRVTVEVRIDAIGGQAGYGNLTIREDFALLVAGFTELASVLGRFHDLAEKVKGEHATDDQCGYFAARGEHGTTCCPIGRKRAQS